MYDNAEDQGWRQDGSQREQGAYWRRSAAGFREENRKMMFFFWTGTEYNDLIARLTRIETAIKVMAQMEDKLVGITTALTASIATLAGNIASLGDEITVAVAALQAAVAADDQPAIDAATAQVTALAASVASSTVNLAAALTPPAAPTV